MEVVGNDIRGLDISVVVHNFLCFCVFHNVPCFCVVHNVLCFCFGDYIGKGHADGGISCCTD